jgi:DNA-binding transcriptional LysR family regulator
MDGLGRSVRALAAGESGTVSLGAQGAALIEIVPQAMRRLAAERPALHVAVRQLTSEEIAEELELGRLDLGITRDVDPRAGLMVTELRRESVMAVLLDGHRLATAPAVGLADLGLVFAPLRDAPAAVLQLVREERPLSAAAARVADALTAPPPAGGN